MLEIPERLIETTEQVQAAFELVHRRSFAGTSIVNPKIKVEALPAGVVDTSDGEQLVVVLITPWTMNGLVLPGSGLPSELNVAGHQRAVTVIDLPELGQYAQVNLVPDVSKYTGHSQALTIAQSMVEPLLTAVAAAR